MGAVYEGTQESLGRRVAIKVLKSRGGLTAAELERFGREARSAAALGHPNIVQVTDFHADTDPPFLVMERLLGESLREAIQREKRLSTARVALIGTQLLDALAAAHRAGIVHRDIKPDNVFLTRMAGGADLVKVVDFGVAKLLGDRPITAHGARMGSPAYMSPEQALGGNIDHRADLWGVAATLYHALAGRLPFDAQSLPELLAWLAERPPTPLAEIVPGIDSRMVRVLDRALAKDLGQRYFSAGEMQAALEPLLPSLTSSASNEGPRALGLAPGETANGTRRSPVASTVPGGPMGPSPAVAEPSGHALSNTRALEAPQAVLAQSPASYAGSPGASRAALPAFVPLETTKPKPKAWLVVTVAGAVAVFLLVTGGLLVFVFRPPPGAPHEAKAVVTPAATLGPAPTAPAPGPLATRLPASWADPSPSNTHCTALRIAPFARGKDGTFLALPAKEAEGLGSHLGSTLDECTARCEASPWELYRVRISYDGTVTEARVPRDASKCPARDDCVDLAMRNAYLDAPPNEQESVVEVVCTFE